MFFTTYNKSIISLSAGLHPEDLFVHLAQVVLKVVNFTVLN
jgi:hypothetical protein